jgi:MFS family permease
MFTKVPAAIFWVMPRSLFPPGAGGSARCFINAIANIGGLLGPLIVGWLSTMFSMQVGFMSLVAFLLLGASLCWLLPASTSGKDGAAA